MSVPKVVQGGTSVQAQQTSMDHTTLLAYQKQYHQQRRLADALSGLFHTLGSALQVERVVNVGLLTLTGQLLIKCAAFFQRDASGSYHLLATVGARDPRLSKLEIPGHLPQIVTLFRDRTAVDIAAADVHPTLDRLRAHGFRHLFPLTEGVEPLGIIALGEKIVPSPLAAEDLQMLDAFGIVIAISLKNSVTYQLMETGRNELERLTEMKRDFLSHVSHEFRTPLTVLKNIFDIIEVDPEIRSMQRSSLARLEHLIDSILLLNEINASALQLERQLVDGARWAETHVRPILERQGRFELRSDLPSCTLELDCFKLGMAIESLANNAVKFGGEHSGSEVRLYLSTRERVARRLQDPQRDTQDLAPGFLRSDTPPALDDPDLILVIEVKDLGIGIPDGELDAVFQPFTQAANSPTRGVRGAGLGLAMSKRIVDAHGGEIFCRSVVGHGTIFYIAVPAAPARRF